MAWFRFWETPAGAGRARSRPAGSARRGREGVAGRGAPRGRGARRRAGPDPPEAARSSHDRRRARHGRRNGSGRSSPRARTPRAPSRRAGDDRVIGQGKDAGRLPGSLWGERPGEAWFVLETLVRLREGNAEAPLVPSESRDRGRETERALLGVRLAMAEGNAPLALDLAEEHPGRADDPAWRSAHLRLLATAGRAERAREILQRDIRRAQAHADGSGPADVRDPGSGPGPRARPGSPRRLPLPCLPALLAYLRDRRGADVAARFTTSDRPGLPGGARVAMGRERARSLGRAGPLLPERALGPREPRRSPGKGWPRWAASGLMPPSGWTGSASPSGRRPSRPSPRSPMRRASTPSRPGATRPTTWCGSSRSARLSAATRTIGPSRGSTPWSPPSPRPMPPYTPGGRPAPGGGRGRRPGRDASAAAASSERSLGRRRPARVAAHRLAPTLPRREARGERRGALPERAGGSRRADGPVSARVVAPGSRARDLTGRPKDASRRAGARLDPRRLGARGARARRRCARAVRSGRGAALDGALDAALHVRRDGAPRPGPRPHPGPRGSRARS